MQPLENPDDVYIALLRECQMYEHTTGEKEYEISISLNLYNILNSLNSDVRFHIRFDVSNGERTLWGHPLNVVHNKPPFWFLLGEGKTLRPF